MGCCVGIRVVQNCGDFSVAKANLPYELPPCLATEKEGSGICAPLCTSNDDCPIPSFMDSGPHTAHCVGGFCRLVCGENPDQDRKCLPANSCQSGYCENTGSNLMKKSLALV